MHRDAVMCSHVQSNAWYKQAYAGHQSIFMQGYAVICIFYADICTHMQTYARPMQGICKHIHCVSRHVQDICKYVHYKCKDMQSYAWHMLEYADIYIYMQNICKHVHQVCKHMQAYAFYNYNYADIWYHMQEYAIKMNKYT